MDRGQKAEDAVSDLAELGLVVVPLDRAQAEASGALRRVTRVAGLSLGDRACLALAASNDAIAITADRAWTKVATDIRIELVR